MTINIKSNEDNFYPIKLLTWDKVKFIDGKENEHPVKSLTLKIEAGEVAILTVERYAMNGLFNAVSNDPKDGHKPLTYKMHYGVEDFSADIEVKGPLELKDRTV
jgi:hypothetical protein